MVHCGSIRQTASILTMNKDCLRTGDKAKVKFRFIKHPEYIKTGQRMVFREGRTKAVSLQYALEKQELIQCNLLGRKHYQATASHKHKFQQSKTDEDAGTGQQLPESAEPESERWRNVISGSHQQLERSESQLGLCA